MTETIVWKETAEELPDADETVLVFFPEGDEPVWLAYLDGKVWRDLDASRLDTKPIRWARMPTGEPPQP